MVVMFIGIKQVKCVIDSDPGYMFRLVLAIR